MRIIRIVQNAKIIMCTLIFDGGILAEMCSEKNICNIYIAFKNIDYRFRKSVTKQLNFV